LAEALLHNPTLLGRTTPFDAQQRPFPPILELGAGTGFLSIFLGQIGCARVWSSDVGDEDEYPGSEDDGERYLALDSGMKRRGPLDGLIANLNLSE
jgi:hypothetical protein